MKRIAVLLAVIVLASACIGQQEAWSADQWKTHLILMNPNVEQSIGSMTPGVMSVEEIPIGTHMAFQITEEAVVEGMEMPITMTMTLDVVGEETVQGKQCTVAEVVMDMNTEMEGESLSMVFEYTEWVDSNGTPIKIDGEMKMTMFGMETPMKITSELTGEEEYQGVDCWVFSGTYTMDMGFASQEMEIIQYMDKETYAVVKMTTDGQDMNIPDEYMEASTFMTGLTWELGERETITTELGTYDCQKIYLKDGEKTVGTIWANEDVRAPIKYVVSYEMEGMHMDLTMILTEYVWGE